MIEFDDREIRQYRADLVAFQKRALPFAAKNTINSVAFAVRSRWQSEIRKNFQTRNRFTENSIRVEQARGLYMPRQFAIVGSVAPYMDDQEFGGTKQKRGKTGVAIPTTYSAGQSEGTRPRTRLPRKPNRMSSIRLRRNRLKGGRRQRNLITVKSGNKYVFLDLGRRKGIFRVVGGKRRPRVKMVYDLTRQSIRVPATPTLGPAAAKVTPLVGGIYRRALAFQLERLGIFKKVL